MPVFSSSIDHCAYVVPDLDAAVNFLGTYFGFQTLWTRDAIHLSGDQNTSVYAMPSSATGRSARLQLGATQLELREWKVSSEALNPLRESSVPGCHIALQVPDLQTAMAELRNIPRMRFMQPEPQGGSVFCFTPYGFAILLVQSAYAS